MKQFLVRLTEWWRGWTNEDLASVLRKTENTKPGEFVAVTDAEFRAHLAFSRGHGA